MIWVLVCALVSLGVAEELDILYPDLEHSRTIYVTGKTRGLAFLTFCTRPL